MRLFIVLSVLLFSINTNASFDSKHWPASDEARQFVKDTAES